MTMYKREPQLSLADEALLWAFAHETGRINLREDTPALRVSGTGLEPALGQVRVSQMWVEKDQLVLKVSAGTEKRRIRATLSIPLCKIDLARYLAAEPIMPQIKRKAAK
jgi:hypothetical protein